MSVSSLSSEASASASLDAAAVAQAAPFHVAEYEALRAEIRDNISGLRITRNAMLVVPGVVYGAMLADINSLTLTMAAGVAWIPVFLHIVIMQFWDAEAAAVRRLAGYVRQIEKIYALGVLRGWETHNEYLWATGQRSMTFRRAMRLPWWAQLVAMIALATGLSLLAAAKPVFGVDVGQILSKS